MSFDLVDLLAGVVGEDLVQALAEVRTSLAWISMSVAWPSPAGRLVDHDAGVGQREALALGATGEQQRAHAVALPTQMVVTSRLMYCIVS